MGLGSSRGFPQPAAGAGPVAEEPRAAGDECIEPAHLHLPWHSETTGYLEKETGEKRTQNALWFKSTAGLWCFLHDFTAR